MTKQEKAKDARLRRELHTTLEEWNRVYEYQKRCCGICKKEFNKKGLKLILSVDHSHKSGLKRGLLCYMCNKGIAIFRDNIDKLRNAVIYFEHNPFTVVFGEERFTAPGKIGAKKRIKQLAEFNAARGDGGKEETN